jgi:hypothetical protein
MTAACPAKKLGFIFPVFHVLVFLIAVLFLTFEP